MSGTKALPGASRSNPPVRALDAVRLLRMGAPPPPHPMPRTLGPWTWTVTWGVLARPGFVVERVVAYDADEALVLAAARRPDLPRPLVAFLDERA